MMNMQNMMRQAQKLQKQMEKGQKELAATDFMGHSAQDLVTVTMTGDRQVKAVAFKPEVVDPEDMDTLQDMTVQAINDALDQITKASEKAMGPLAGKLPF